MKIVVGIQCWENQDATHPLWTASRVIKKEYEERGFTKELEKVFGEMLEFEKKSYPRKVCTKCKSQE